jgi:hypothetical protein
VARAPLFGRLVAILVAVVPGADFDIADRQLVHQRFKRQDDVIRLRLFRDFKALLVLFVVFLKRRGIDFHLASELLRRETQLGDLTFL